MNVGDVITRVRRTFGDEAAVQVTDADVIRWINDAQIEVVKHNDGALQKTDTIDLVANQSTYAMPSDLLILRAIRYKYSDMQSFVSIKYKNMAQFDDSVDGWDGTAYPAGHPYFFTMYAGSVVLFPTPDRAMVDGLKILYNQKPVDVATELDSLALPLIYHNTVVKYCMWQASLLDEDHEPALMYKQSFDGDMDMLRTRETQEATQTYATITVLDDDL
jgi:hypothetical protein